MFFKLFRSLLVSLKEKSPSHLFSCFSFQSVLILLPIVLLFFCHLILHSSFYSCPLGSCSLIYFYHVAWKESRQNRKEQPFHSFHSPHSQSCHVPFCVACFQFPCILPYIPSISICKPLSV